MEKKTLWELYSDKQLKELEKVNTTYKDCISRGKTERECVSVSVEMAEKAGYKPLDAMIGGKKSLKAGDKVYAVYNEKTMILFNIGKDPIEDGMNILGAHIDSPRVDVKQIPLYDDTGIAYFDTRYYGGIKKYQWVTIPLALHGVVVKQDGSKVYINIGEKDDDPVFAISDLLIHLAQDQMEKPASKVIEGEKMDLIVGSIPLKDEEKEPVKANILKLLNDSYGIGEEDFLSAELEIVPAGKARDMGFDRSMIMGYGHDDRICAFTSLMAQLDIKGIPQRTACCILVDKEEIGSMGASGMQSKFFENTVAEIMELTGETTVLSLRRALKNSRMLSSDVSAAYDPMFAEVFEKKNSCYFGKGPVFNKFTGGRGKGGSSDANPEYIAQLRNIFAKNNVQFQLAELGKVDIGGGGTIAYIMANYGMEVIDSGIAVLCMHAPMEIASKADIYEAVRGYSAFLSDMKKNA